MGDDLNKSDLEKLFGQLQKMTASIQQLEQKVTDTNQQLQKVTDSSKKLEQKLDSQLGRVSQQIGAMNERHIRLARVRCLGHRHVLDRLIFCRPRCNLRPCDAIAISA